MRQIQAKEIGVRRALGVSVTKIIFLQTIDFTKWALIANIIAWPVAFQAMSKWM